MFKLCLSVPLVYNQCCLPSGISWSSNSLHNQNLVTFIYPSPLPEDLSKTLWLAMLAFLLLFSKNWMMDIVHHCTLSRNSISRKWHPLLVKRFEWSKLSLSSTTVCFVFIDFLAEVLGHSNQHGGSVPFFNLSSRRAPYLVALKMNDWNVAYR